MTLRVDAAAPGVLLTDDDGNLQPAPAATGFTTTTPIQTGQRGYIVTKGGREIKTNNPTNTPLLSLAEALRLVDENPGADATVGYFGTYIDKSNVKQGAIDGPSGTQIIGYAQPGTPLTGVASKVLDEAAYADWKTTHPGEELKPVTRNEFTGTVRSGFFPAQKRYDVQAKAQSLRPQDFDTPTADQQTLLDAVKASRSAKAPTAAPAAKAGASATKPARPSFLNKAKAGATKSAAPSTSTADPMGGMF